MHANVGVVDGVVHADDDEGSFAPVYLGQIVLEEQLLRVRGGVEQRRVHVVVVEHDKVHQPCRKAVVAGAPFVQKVARGQGRDFLWQL